MAIRINGVHHFPDGGTWVPEGREQLVGCKPNPSQWAGWGRPSRATLFVGLKVDRPDKGLPKGFKVPVDWLYGIVFRLRTSQVGFDYGSSFLRQKGHYIPPQAKAIGSEQKRRESSVQVILFPAPTENWAVFRRNVRIVATALLDQLGQISIIGEFVKNGVAVEVGSFKWVPPKRKR